MPPFTFNAFPAFNPDLMIGALEIGSLVAICLFGVTSVQTYMYFRHFTADPRGITLMVWIVWLLDFGHAIAVCHLIYTLTITDYGVGIQSLYIPPVSIDIAILLSAFIGTIEQAWFIWRLYVFSKNIYLAGTCAILSFARFVGSMGLSVVVLHKIPLPEYTTRWGWLVTSIMGTAAVNDVLLAAFLAYCLNSTKDRTSQGTARLLNKLIVIAVESGAITSVCAVALLVCFLTMPLNSIYMGLFVVLGKLYSNAFLASLNARRSLVHSFGNVTQFHNSDTHATSTPRFRRATLTSDDSSPSWAQKRLSLSRFAMNPSIIPHPQEAAHEFEMTHTGSERSESKHVEGSFDQVLITTHVEKFADSENDDERLEMATRPNVI